MGSNGNWQIVVDAFLFLESDAGRRSSSIIFTASIRNLLLIGSSGNWDVVVDAFLFLLVSEMTEVDFDSKWSLIQFATSNLLSIGSSGNSGNWVVVVDAFLFLFGEITEVDF